MFVVKHYFKKNVYIYIFLFLKELVLYLLQLVQALRYENFKKPNKNTTTTQNSKLTNNNNNNTETYKINAINDNFNRTNYNNNDVNSIQQNMFAVNLKTFLINRAKTNEIVAYCLFWYVKVEMGDKSSEQELKTNSFIYG